MIEIPTVTRSFRATRLAARVPRIAAVALALVLIAAGLRAALAGPPQPAPSRHAAAPAPIDQGAQAFAEAFARAYLSWNADDPTERAERLRPFLSGLDADDGLRPASGTKQDVLWTAVVAARRTRQAQLITIAVHTTERLLYLSVPVARSKRGFLHVAGYPALVGPPAIEVDAPAHPDEQDVEDPALVAVVDRAVRNYLASNRSNLRADLTPDALVSLPTERFAVERVTRVTWVFHPRRVAVELQAVDGQQNVLTLRYELEVTKRDRWYVRSVQTDPTFRGDA